MYRADDVIRLESAHLILTADPACGGKLRSLVSKSSGKDVFYQDRRAVFDPARGYSYHDISGWDECFPCVAACAGTLPDGRTYAYPDHGALWQRSWEARTDHGVLTMCCALEEYGCIFTRRCTFADEQTLLLEYRIENRGEHDVPYVYSAHTLLAANEETRVVFPAEMTRAFNYVAADNFGLPNGAWFELPGPNAADLTGPFTPRRGTFIKLFSDRLTEGRCVVEYPDRGERLVMTFDVHTLPYVGFLAQQGYDGLGDGHFANEILLAFEPTTGIGDDLSTCVRTGALSMLAPGAVASFWIRVVVERV